ncbi:N-acetylmuramic acid 6-phosphate etherase [Breznakiella homolactica]|uniref:N-acetylmuramic acid 6-phosphate etherase n=1 Tax=Breznakiella homolactica TaxID=2798577 RepID=A0A7T7XS42_9SPIR|nr:N-acetylmuramic acid 6-phosphate etherase [Breznakiella homolactica]QQO11438.1 N-acetylmuramic acid 6-phosphate etherase [Breznakiella homolactica]
MLDGYTTEQRNEVSADIDSKDALEIVTIINNEDRKVPVAVGKILPQIAALVDDIVAAFKKGGRLVYIGAGTSGRLGVLDASECPPTYGVSPEMVQGLIAGGLDALTRSIESAEDRADAGIQDLKNISFGKDDVLVGITASGQAPYVLGALQYARDLGAVTGAISCNGNSRTFDVAKHILYADVGPEVVTGSTRMKSGTAQKLILNMLSTASMIRLGKVYKNLMVDLTPVNQKLVIRSIRLIRQVTGCSTEEAETAFNASGKKPKIAIVMVLLNVGRERAEQLLTEADGHISKVEKSARKGT